MYRICTAAAAPALAVIAVAAALLSGTARAGSAPVQDPCSAGPPVVRITAPGDGSTHGWHALVNYRIVVCYDGKSTRYQEIPSREVLLEATFVPDLAAMARRPARAAIAAGLMDIVDSNCLGCHDFKAKSMGPSFAAIAARYPDSEATIDRLGRHIREGSTGVWGRGSMPSHAGLSAGRLHAIVLWIMRDAANPSVSYYVGTEGAIRMAAPGHPGPKAGMILTASYTSPTRPAGAKQAAYGEDTVILHGR